MTIGDKIKRIRSFRGMTQKELGLAIGFEDKGADNRIAQYETNYRVPKKELLDKIADALHVDRQNFSTDAPGSAEDLMRTLFWLEEDNPGSTRLFQLVQDDDKSKTAENTVHYQNSDRWPVHAPVGLYFQYGLADEFMREWLQRQSELQAGEISKSEYFEWKLNWPRTCDSCGKREPDISWRKKLGKQNTLLNSSFSRVFACL